MHNNYYFLRQLTAAFEPMLVGRQLMTCFSQEKDELVLGFADTLCHQADFYIKAIVYPDFSCLYFPENFERAKKNSANLFSQIIDHKVISVTQFLNERCFSINFENNYCLLFKLYAKRSNIILLQNGIVEAMFHSRIVADQQIILEHLDRRIDQSEAALIEANGDYKKLFPTFGKIVSDYLLEKITPANKWSIIENTLQKLNKPNYYLTKIAGVYHLSLLAIGEIFEIFHEPIKAANAFYIQYSKCSTLDLEKAQIIKKITKEILHAESYISQNKNRLQTLLGNIKNEEIGHILMANLHQIPEQAASASLFDFYRNTQIEIKLKPDLSPQRNAENYYRKAKNEKIEVDKLSENIALRNTRLMILAEKLNTVKQLNNLKDLRSYLKTNTPNTGANQEKSVDIFKKILFEGFEIWIGKNAKNNDLLTQKHAYKEDMWLHARDTKGSHVLIKYQANKRFPINVIERAAEVAAYYSKRKTESLCPVIYTPKKFVRKPKGFADGMVLVEKENVLMIEPKA